MTTRIRQFDLEFTLGRLKELAPDNLRRFPPNDLERILANFLMKWGQKLQLETLAEQDDAYPLHQFARRYLPFAIARDFPAVTPYQVTILASAMTAILFFAFLTDESIDAPKTIPVAPKLALQPILFCGQRWLSQLFAPDSPFWDRAEHYIWANMFAVEREYRQQSDSVHDYSLDNFRRFAIEKAALAQIARMGLCLLNGTPELVPLVERCFDVIALTAAIQDDIRDWPRDYESKNYTYLLSQVLSASPLRDQFVLGNMPSPKLLAAAIICSGILESMYDLAWTELEAAILEAESSQLRAISGLLHELKNEVEKDYESLIQNNLRVLAGASLPSTM